MLATSEMPSVGILHFASSYNIKCSEAEHSDKRATLDQVFRDLLLTLLSSPQVNVPVWQQFVTYCIQACRLDLCTPTMPVVLLGDIFDALTLDECEQLFRFVEDGVSIWKEDLFFSACKNNLLRIFVAAPLQVTEHSFLWPHSLVSRQVLSILRTLRWVIEKIGTCRPERYMVTCCVLSQDFGVAGLNIVSEFNLDNVTEYGGEGVKDLDILSDKDDSMEEGSKPETNRMKLDYNLYCKFWALQDYFRNPNQCYNKMEWKTFSSHASSVLQAFQSFKLEDLQLKHSNLVPEAELGGKQHYFAKFLTNQKLLELQLSDSNFRRYVLLQFLILFQYLNSPVKFKS
ncbi:hypothetical protein PR048_020746 [Dryococelus australis]|uniref:Uncharacterized protein n=1 Tax=Dryococelus australis TaxID=614101 RepID=A0ABQ9GW93_9NEOP|nr:hypothetical protein PR048_020746 [Dryococelus australis]